METIMKDIVSRTKTPALIGLLFTIPFILLEWVNRRTFNEGFPFPLFGILWSLPTAFVLILMPAIKNFKTGNKLMFSLQTGLLLFIAFLWFAIIRDQLPCFLGIPNCD